MAAIARERPPRRILLTKAVRFTPRETAAPDAPPTTQLLFCSALEQETFNVGLANNYMVIQYQTYLAQAQSTEVAAKGAYAKAMIALDRATASTLEVNQVSIQEARNGRVSRPAARIPNP